MAHWLRELAVLVEDLGSIPSFHRPLTDFCNYSGDPMPSSGLFGYCMHVVRRHMPTDDPYTYKKKTNPVLMVNIMLTLNVLRRLVKSGPS